MSFLKSGFSRGLGYSALAAISGALLSISWTVGGAYWMFFAIAPLLYIESGGISKKELFCYNSTTIIVWHILSLLWIAKAAPVGVYASAATYIVLWNIPLLSYSYARRNISKKIAYFVLVTGFIAIEYLNLSNNEITFPWLVLGNGFINSLSTIQWYEYTGVLGGSLLVVISNILIFEYYLTRKRLFVILDILLAVSALLISQIIYHNHNPREGREVKAAITQPNFDPYEDKFSMNKVTQLTIIDSILQSVPRDVEYIVLPETTLNEELNEKILDGSGTIQYQKRALRDRFPEADMIMGAVTYIVYNNSPNRPTLTARGDQKSGWYDVSNSSLYINPNRQTELYRKSKLVIGVEMLPFNNVLSMLGDLSVKLGGTSGVLLPQDNFGVNIHTKSGLVSASPVCYESIYGEHFSGFVREGAEVMFVVTNDGWWDETYGYKQHFAYSRLRAIETRRWIGRSANTGISAIIDSRGEVVERLGWWQRGAIVGTLYAKDRLTFYTKYGDYIGKVGWYCFILLLLYMLSINFRNRLP